MTTRWHNISFDQGNALMILRPNHLSRVRFPAPEALAMHDATRSELLELLQALNLGDVWDGIVPARDDDGVEPLLPPIIRQAAVLSKGDFPLVAYFLDPLHGGLVRHQVLVAVPLEQTLNVRPQHGPVSERRVLAVQGNRVCRAVSGNRLLAERHGSSVDVGLQVRVYGRVSIARHAQLRGLSGKTVGSRDGRVGGAGRDRLEIGHQWRGGLVSDPSERPFVSMVLSPLSELQLATSGSRSRAGAVIKERKRGFSKQLNLPAAAGGFATFKHSDEVKVLLLGQGIDGDGPGRPCADDSHSLDGSHGGSVYRLAGQGPRRPKMSYGQQIIFNA